MLPWVNPATHQQQVRLRFRGKNFPPGGSRGLIRFNTAKHYIPAEFIQKRQRSLGIFVLQDQTASFKALPGAQEGQSVAAALPAETLIITSPLKLLSDKQSVSIQP